MKKVILILIASVLAMTTGYGQGTKLSSFPDVTTDTGVNFVCVSDSGGVYKDKLLPPWLLIAYMEGVVTDFVTLDYVLAAGHVTGRMAVWTNGSGQYMALDSLGAGIQLKNSTPDTASLTATGLWTNISGLGYGLWQGGYGWVQWNNGGGNAFITGGFHGGRMGFNDYTSNYSDTLLGASLSHIQKIWLPPSLNAPVGGVVNDSVVLRSIMNSYSDSVARACDSVATWKVDSVARACDSVATWKVDSAMATVASPVVSSANLLAQTTLSINSLISYTPASGVVTYQLNAYLNINSISGGCNVSIVVGWKDENGNSAGCLMTFIATTTNTIYATATGYVSMVPIVIRAVAGTAIGVSVNTNSTGAVNYDVGASLIKIN